MEFEQIDYFLYLCIQYSESMKMDPNKYLYQDVNDTLDVVSLILSEGKVLEIGKEILSYIICFDKNKDKVNLTPDTQIEQCILTISEGFKYVNTPDFLTLALQAVNEIDIKKLWLITMNGSINEQLIPPTKIKLFYNSERYKDTFFKVLEVDEGTKQIIDSVLKEACDDSSKLNALQNYLKNENQFKYFITCLAAAELEDRYKLQTTSPINIESYITWVSKKLTDKYLDDYYKWNLVTKNKIEQLYYLEVLYHFIYVNIKELSNPKLIEEEKDKIFNQMCKACVLSSFLTYWLITAEDGFDYISKRISILCNNPVNTYKFVDFLKKNDNGVLLTNLYNEYCRNNKIEPAFPIELVFDRPSKPVKDNDLNHSNWFETIPMKKVKGRTDEQLLTALIKLYNNLIYKNYLSTSTPLKVFIYRFSGFLPAFSTDPLYKLEFKSHKNILATIIGLLYGPNPPYAKCLGFFYPSISNGSALFSKANNDLKLEVKEMLYQCGFVKLDE